MNTCLICKNLTNNKKFCSRKCYNKFHSAEKIEIKCKWCSKKILKCIKNNRIFCSKNCYLQFHKTKLLNLKCEICDKLIMDPIINYRIKKSCSKKCQYKLMSRTRINKGNRKPLKLFNCSFCKKKFKRIYYQKYCSNECVYKSKIKLKKIFNCPTCNKEIKITYNNPRKYCSNKCSNQSLLRKNKISKTVKIRRMERKKKLGYINSPETRKKLSLIMKKKWKDPAYAKRIVESSRAPQNKLERRIELLLKKIDLSWDFVGDGKFVIGYPPKNPDFVHKKSRLILEVFGAYWHEEDEVSKLIKHYNKYNFDCVILWDYELKNIDHIKLNKLIESNLSGKVYKLVDIQK